MKYIKIYRIDDKEFHCKPYTSKFFHHSFEFIDTEITNLELTHQKIAISKLHKPRLDDKNWSGCFCFLDEFEPRLLSPTGALAMRYGQKINVRTLPINTQIWVRNCSYKGKEYPFFSEFLNSYIYEGNEHWYPEFSTFHCYRWVRMSVDLALKRTRLFKKYSQSDWLPEWLTEFYLLEEQLFLLKKPNLKDAVSARFWYIKQKVSSKE